MTSLRHYINIIDEAIDEAYSDNKQAVQSYNAGVRGTVAPKTGPGARPPVQGVDYDPANAKKLRTASTSTLSRHQLMDVIKDEFESTNPTSYPVQIFAQNDLGVRISNGLLVQIMITAGAGITYFGVRIPSKLREAKPNAQMYQLLKDNGYKPNPPNQADRVTCEKFSNVPVETIAKQFWKMVDLMEEVNTGAGSGGKRVSTASQVTRKMTPSRYYLNAAINIFNGVKFGTGSMLPRGGGEGGKLFDINDNQIAVGATEAALEVYKKTRDWKGNGLYREHAVPAKVIVDTAIKMIKDRPKRSDSQYMGPSDMALVKEVADMISRNLSIVYCTNAEAAEIDKKYQSTMPQGWKDGDSIFARFDAFDIPVYDFKGAPLTEEDDDFDTL